MIPTENKIPPSRPITFTLPELWMLSDFIRADCSQLDTWRYPPASLYLNDEICDAITTCEKFKLLEYTLLLTKGDCIVIDHSIRRDYKNPDGAKGLDILRKIYKARYELREEMPTAEGDVSFKEASDAIASPNTDNHPDSNPTD